MDIDDELFHLLFLGLSSGRETLPQLLERFFMLIILTTSFQATVSAGVLEEPMA